MSDKLFRPLLIVLLLVVVGLQVYNLVPVARCQEAITNAAKVRSDANNKILNAVTNYEADVYGDKVDNINQQMLLASENTFMLNVVQAQLQAAELEVQEACR